MGCTNAGKSSLLNAIVSTSSKVSSRIRLRNLARNPNSRWANRKRKDPAPDMTLEELLDIIASDRFLTESDIPGTTLDFHKVQGAKKIHAKVYDTPGIPSLNSFDLFTPERPWRISKKLNPKSLKLTDGTAVWLGALARLDIIEGNTATFTFCMNN